MGTMMVIGDGIDDDNNVSKDSEGDDDDSEDCDSGYGCHGDTVHDDGSHDRRSCSIELMVKNDGGR